MSNSVKMVRAHQTSDGKLFMQLADANAHEESLVKNAALEELYELFIDFFDADVAARLHGTIKTEKIFRNNLKRIVAKLV